MLFRLMLLLTVIPLIEVYFLLRLGETIGGANTFAVVILTGILGAWLLRHQGASIMADLQKQAAQNQLPADAATKGLFVFIGGVLLLTPGVLTDLLGFSFIIPQTQKLWRKMFMDNWQKGVRSGNIKFYSNMNFGQGPQSPFETERKPRFDDVIDVEAKSSTTKKDH